VCCIWKVFQRWMVYSRVFWLQMLCMHSKWCVLLAPQLWNKNNRAWTAVPTTTWQRDNNNIKDCKQNKKHSRERHHYAHALWLTAHPWEVRCRRTTTATVANDVDRCDENKKISHIIAADWKIIPNRWWDTLRHLKKAALFPKFAVFTAVTERRGRQWRQVGSCTHSVKEDCLLIKLFVFMQAIRHPRYIYFFVVRGKAAVFGSLAARSCVCVYSHTHTHTHTRVHM